MKRKPKSSGLVAVTFRHLPGWFEAPSALVLHYFGQDAMEPACGQWFLEEGFYPTSGSGEWGCLRCKSILAKQLKSS